MIAASFAVAAPVSLAGNVNPPPGPVQPTGITLTEIIDQRTDIETQAGDALLKLVEIDPGVAIESLSGDAAHDFIITEPGRYYLSANYVGDGANTVIDVRVSDVEIDLRGFMITGDAFFSNEGAWAIDTIGGVDNVTVRNGTVYLFGDNAGGGIRLNGEHCVVEDVRVVVSQGTALNVGGAARIERCAVFGTVGGISVGDGSSIQDCQASIVVGSGFVIGGTSSVDNCTADSCDSGFTASHGTVFDGCVASRNATDGFDVIGCVLRACTARTNLNGFRALQSRLTVCNASDNAQAGYYLAAGNHVTRCSAIANTLGGFNIVGIRNHVASNYSGQHLTGYGYWLQSSATDCFLVKNFAEANALYYDLDTTNGNIGTLRVGIPGAGPWDNFSN
ncbi:MAG: hypothetical protein AAFX05_06890 [Planctomycetota bacterium]